MNTKFIKIKSKYITIAKYVSYDFQSTPSPSKKELIVGIISIKRRWFGLKYLIVLRNNKLIKNSIMINHEILTNSIPFIFQEKFDKKEIKYNFK